MIVSVSCVSTYFILILAHHKNQPPITKASPRTRNVSPTSHTIRAGSESLNRKRRSETTRKSTPGINIPNPDLEGCGLNMSSPFAVVSNGKPHAPVKQTRTCRTSHARRATEIDLHGVYHEICGRAIGNGLQMESGGKICHRLRFA